MDGQPMAEIVNHALTDPLIRERHYLIRSEKHARRWVAFSPRRVRSYRDRYGDDFCLVVTGDPGSASDFYALPWSALAKLLTDANRFHVKQKNGSVSLRWQFHLEGPPHHFQLEFAPSDLRERPRFDATKWYGNMEVLGLV